ncbi:hypothetical protein DUB99_23755 [Salmonella enterica subsp. enterica serovar Bonariensis]|nr:hypothetical protein [Salmonella enterica]EBW7040965.1 hypothetical protein [Salmonella enterica subsp. enterica serovar Bonariensis]EDT7939620.1 hypothetical protein [Salmonella enterica subsp. enterica serovar Aba]EHM1654580.1 hypothetical protein [Salmonella enterica subsp. enterica serovar Saintpaul]EBY0067792.1 hypothetical protein [Salmonella enterica subsp. enterica serovar Bonariensis]
MKKSMAGQGAAGALLLAGLMMSTGAMAASGDPVQGGSGSVTINVPIVTSTCSVTVPTEVNFDPIDRSWLTSFSESPADMSIGHKYFDIVFSNCKDKTLQMNVQSSKQSNQLAYFDSGDPDRVLYYYIKPPMDADITGGGLFFGSERVFNFDNTLPVLIKPGSDNYAMTLTVELSYKHGRSLANLGPAVSTSFTYNVTYQ